MGDQARTTKIVIPRYNRVPFSTTLDGTHEFLLTEGRDKSRTFKGGEKMCKRRHEYR
jgi:hypothetical protein